MSTALVAGSCCKPAEKHVPCMISWAQPFPCAARVGSSAQLVQNTISTEQEAQ